MNEHSNGWAVVTGASSGLGAEFARQLGAKGYDLVLVARRKDRLDELASQIHRDHQARVLTFERDLSETNAGGRLVSDLDREAIAPVLLVNNAGIGQHGAAVDLSIAQALHMIRLNVGALTELALELGKRMALRGSGAIINVASTAAFQPTPYFAVYAATKAYVASLSQALSCELSPRGVRVLAHCPGPTRTEFFSANGVDVGAYESMAMSTERCVRVALRALERRRWLVVPGFLNRLGAWAAQVMPTWLVIRVAARVMRPPTPKSGNSPTSP